MLGKLLSNELPPILFLMGLNVKLTLHWAYGGRLSSSFWPSL
jgi:hypothetical protein